MLINREGASLEIDGKTYTIGMYVYATDASGYSGLYGRIIEFTDFEDEQTSNGAVRIVCEFFAPNDLTKLAGVAAFFSGFYNEPMEIEDVPLSYAIMAPNKFRVVKRCRIYQIEPPDSESIFRGYSNVIDKGLASPPAELYKVVFDGQLDTDDLKDIFRIFNIEHPEGYAGRSLSMSDIVELYDDVGSSFHYCDTWGFRDINFDPAADK